MKRILFILATIFFIVPAGSFAYSINKPLCTQGEAWHSVVDNAYKIAGEYAMAHNPNATFETSIEDYRFIKQTGGNFKGKYLLEITTTYRNDYNVAFLLPLFDVNQPSDELNTDKPLWKVVSAQLNGKSY